MDGNASPSGNVEQANLKHEDDDSHIVKKQTIPSQPQPEDSYSVTARWRKRTADYKDLHHRTIPQWCQQDSPAIADLKLPIHSGPACCTMCKAIAKLQASCESFVEAKAKKEYPAAHYAIAQQNQLAEAEELQVEVERTFAEEASHQQVMPSSYSSQMDRLRELLTMRAARQEADHLAFTAEHLAFTAEHLACCADLFASAADLIHRGHCDVKFLLGALKAAGNSTTRETENSRSSSRSTDSLDSRFTTEYQSHPSTYDKLCDPPVLELHKVDFLQSLTSEQIDLLVPFYKYVQYIFGKALRLDNNDAEYSQKIERTVIAIIGWNIGESMESSSTGVELYLPDNVGQDINGVQAILYAIMIKMAQVLELVPHKMQEQGIPTDENCPHRYADFVSGTSSVEDYLLAILPGMLGIPIEIKPIAQGKKSKIVRTLLKAQHQVVGHLARQALFSLDIGGIGEDCTVVGLALSMGSITAIVLELSDVGTKDVEVNVRRTKWMPLLDKDTRKKFFGEKVKYVEASFEIEEVPHSIPEGFRLLAQTLVSVQHHGIGRSPITSSKGSCARFSMQPDTAESIQLGNYLGSGSFSHVLKLVDKGSNNVFIKVPKFHHVRHCLEREVNALKNLCENNCIPKLYDTDHPIKTLYINIRCESSAVPFLPIRGHIGRPVKQQCNWDSDKLEFVILEVYAALEYANSKGWAHLDVQPSNIITCVDPHGAGCLKVMLVDWGCAHRTSQKRTGYIGCAPFSHDDLFGETNDWYPCLEHDVASLAYTMASLSEGGSIPSWQGWFLDSSKVFDRDKEYRFKIASAILKSLFQKGDAPQKVKEALYNAIDHEGRKLGKLMKPKTSCP